MNIRIEKRKIKVEEYQAMRNTTGWDMLDEQSVSHGLGNDLFSVLAFDNNELIGIARVVGDGAIYFYVQDVIVIPEHQSKGIGKMLMSEVEAFLEEKTNNNSFIGLMAAEGVKEFYYKYGYSERPESRPGMYKMIKK